MKILLAALASEGLLLILATGIVWILNLEISWNPSGEATLLGVGLAALPLVLNSYLWMRTRRYSDSVYARFSKEVIVPLCRQISIPTACSVALLSGWCEEYFFRGALSSAIAHYLGPGVACLVSSLLFAAVHFIGNFRRFGNMIPLYTLMGSYIWIVYYLSNSLFCAAVLHGTYNFAAIVQVKLRAPTDA